ncbi:hypothetical protein ACFLWT_00055 [Chloroflexota bacterium]
MKFLKGLAFFLLTFLLSLSLSVFGLVFMVNSTILNPDFITSEIDRLDVSSLAEEFIGEQTLGGEFSEELEIALVDTIPKLEPLVKEQISAAIYSIFDYLQGERENPELARTLSNTILNSDSVTSVVDELDISSLAGEFINAQFADQMPEGIDEYLDGVIDDTMVDIEPWIKEQIGASADPVVDYLLGESQSLSIVISTEPLVDGLKDNLLQSLLESPPPELAGLPPAIIEQLLDGLFQEFSGMIPVTFEIDETLIGTDMPAEIATMIAQGEDILEQGKENFGYIQTAFYTLIGLMVLLTTGIILLKREVKSSTRKLGITFLIYGVIWYACTFAVKHFAKTWLSPLEIPSSLQAQLPQFLDNLLFPLAMFGLGLLIGGIALIVVSFVYKRGQPQSEP